MILNLSTNTCHYTYRTEYCLVDTFIINLNFDVFPNYENGQLKDLQLVLAKDEVKKLKSKLNKKEKLIKTMDRKLTIYRTRLILAGIDPKFTSDELRMDFDGSSDLSYEQDEGNGQGFFLS